MRSLVDPDAARNGVRGVPCHRIAPVRAGRVVLGAIDAPCAFLCRGRESSDPLCVTGVPPEPAGGKLRGNGWTIASSIHKTRLAPETFESCVQ